MAYRLIHRPAVAYNAKCLRKLKINNTLAMSVMVM